MLVVGYGEEVRDGRVCGPAHGAGHVAGRAGLAAERRHARSGTGRRPAAAVGPRAAAAAAALARRGGRRRPAARSAAAARLDPLLVAAARAAPGELAGLLVAARA